MAMTDKRLHGDAARIAARADRDRRAGNAHEVMRRISLDARYYANLGKRYDNLGRDTARVAAHHARHAVAAARVARKGAN